MMYLEMEKKEHSDSRACSKCKTRALILHSEGILFSYYSQLLSVISDHR